MPDAVWQYWPWLHLAGRTLFGSFFVVFGVMHLARLGRIAAYFERKGVPGPRPVAVVTGIMLLLGGAFVALGWHRFVGAGLLFLLLFPGAWALHPFWNESDPDTWLSELAQFLMTLALAGAALFVAYYGYESWPLSVGG